MCKLLFIVIYLLFVVFTFVWCEFEPGGKPQAYIINPEAESVIGATVSVRRKGSGLFGCGDLLQDGINIVDALQWATNNVNNRLWSGSSANVSLGAHVMDSCGRTRVATLQLAEYLPKLKGEETNVSPAAAPLKIGLIDGVGLNNEPDVTNTIYDLNLPMESVNIDIVSLNKRAEAIINLSEQIGWRHVTVLYSDHLLSNNLLKTFTRVIRKRDKTTLCITGLYNIKNIKMADVYDKNLPVIALLPSEKHIEFFDLLNNENKKSNNRIPVLFSYLVTRNSLKSIPKDIYVLSIIVLPEREVGFEEHRQKHTIFDSFHPDDELELAERTDIARNIQYLVNKFSLGVADTLSKICEETSDHKICQTLAGSRHDSLWERLSTETDGQYYFGIVEYQFRLSYGHVHLHKIMSVDQHNHFEVYDSKYPSLIEDVCRYNSSSSCRCLQIKSDRAELSRHIGHLFKKKNPDKLMNNINDADTGESDYVYYLPAELDHVHKEKTHSSLYTSLRDPVNGTLAGLTLIGALLTLLTGQYFATSAALPQGASTTGTSVLGYLILIGLFLLYSSNISFLFVPSTVTCSTRRLVPALSYALVFSGMLIKVWTSWKQSRGDKLDNIKPTNLIFLALCLTLIQGLFSGLWLLLVPPMVHYNVDSWFCYPSSNELDSHLLLSMTYIVVLLFTTAGFAIRTCAKSENSESRWILISSGLVAITFFGWGVTIATGVLIISRAPAVNLLASTALLFCMYIPKLKLHLRLTRTPPQLLPYPTLDFNKAFPTFTTPNVQQIGLPLKYNTQHIEDRSDSMFSTQDYSNEGGTESISIPFEIDSSSFSDIETEPFRFSTFLEDPQPIQLVHNTIQETGGVEDDDDDPTQVIPSQLYPIDMFSNGSLDDSSEMGEHCVPGTNEFTAPNLCLHTTEWMP